LLANRVNGAQRGDFAARRGIREQARSYRHNRVPVNSYPLSINFYSSLRPQLFPLKGADHWLRPIGMMVNYQERRYVNDFRLLCPY
jgi:hypothetical protein